MTRRRRALLVLGVLAAVAAVAVTALLVNIFEHKQEARNPFYRVVDLNDSVEDPAVWGKNFPMQYDMYLRTVDMKRTLYGGSEAEPHTPTEADPSTVVARSKLEADPRLKEMWAGYAFSKDYRERRGHEYMLDDQTFIERQQFVKQPGTCMNCHASMVTIYNKMGNGDSLHRRHAQSESRRGCSELRRQHHGDTPGDAVVCMWPVPRRVLLPRARKAAGVSME